MDKTQIKSEAKLTFLESTSIIVGHGIGSGILAVPYLASRNSWMDIVWILALAYFISLMMHLMIAELSYHHNGAQFVKCLEGEFFKGTVKKIAGWIAFVMIGLSVLANVSGFIAGASAVFSSWFGLSSFAGMLIYYVLAAAVVFFGMKAVGVCEKIAIYAMFLVVGVLFFAVIFGNTNEFVNTRIAATNMLALFSMVSFSLSAVMSVPQVVKGLEGDAGEIKKSIICGTALNLFMIIVVTFMTLLGTGKNITEDGALVDLSRTIGGWVAVVGYLFTLLALSTSFWANILNLRDIVHEQSGLGLKTSYFAASLPCLIIALLGISSFVGLTRIAGVIQVVTGLGIILAYSRCRKREGNSPICGILGSVPIQIIVAVGSITATVGSLASVV